MFAELAWLVPVFPLVAFLFILLFRGLPRHGAELAIPAVFLSLLTSLGILWETLHASAPIESKIEWLTIGNNHVTMGFLVDPLSAFMAALVSFLALLIDRKSTRLNS